MESEIKRHERASMQQAEDSAPRPSEVHRGRVLALQRELSDARAEISTLKSKGDTALRDSGALREEVSALSDSIEKCRGLNARCSCGLRKRLLAAEASQNERQSIGSEQEKELEELRGRCETAENKISELKGERRAQKEQLGVMRSLLLQAQSELKTRAAESAELKATIETVRASAADTLNQAEKEKAASQAGGPGPPAAARRLRTRRLLRSGANSRKPRRNLWRKQQSGGGFTTELWSCKAT